MRNVCKVCFKSLAKFVLLVWKLFVVCHALTDTSELNYYEKLYFTYNNATTAFTDQIAIMKESDSGFLSIQMNVFGQKLHLWLHKDTRFDDTLIEIHDGEDVKLTTGKEIGGVSYSGTARMEGSAGIIHGTTNGFVTNSIFEGYISFPNDTYYIEDAQKYCAKNCWYNAVIYRSSDVNFKLTNGCLQNPKEYSENDGVMPENLHQSILMREEQSAFSADSFQPNKPRMCNIEIVADYTFYEFMKNGRNVFHKLKQYAQSVDDIFVKTDFNQDGKPDNVGIHPEKFTFFRNNKSDKIFGKYSEDPDELLKAMTNHTQKYCLSTAILHRKFRGKTLGRAYIGKICHAHWKIRKEHLNVAIISSWKHPDAIVVAIIAHEMGHNFGAYHDPPDNKLCSPPPKSPEGAYLMVDFVQDGTRPNNFLFSPCSKDNISGVIYGNQRKGKYQFYFRFGQWKKLLLDKCLETMANYLGRCLEETGIPRCGNARIERGEDCDCGPPENCDFRDKCCIPMGQKGECKVKESEGVQCSPFQGPCCDRKTCRFIQGGECQPSDNNLCTRSGTCRGFSAQCVASEFMPNGTACWMTYMTCFNGRCKSNICEDNLMEICDCKNEDIERCEVCCESPYEPCQPASELGLFLEGDRKALQLLGTPCKEGFVCSRDGACLHQELMLDSDTGIFPHFATGIHWLVISWPYFVLACVTAISIVGFAFGYSYRRSRNSRAKVLAERLKQAKEIVDLKYPEFEKGQRKEHTYRILCRLVALFPNLPIDKLRKVARKHKNEHDAFLYVLLKGQGIRDEV